MYKRLSLCLLIALFALIFVTANSNAESLFSNSGSCGENAIWEYENGVLTITGVGAIDNCSEDSSPWYNIRDNIQSVIIEEGITSIGDYAFYRIDNLTSVSFPSTLECIGTEAFRSAKMESITLPNGLTQIGPSAFGWCTKLKSVDIPDSVTNIGKSAFYCCTHLEKIKISSGITKLEKTTFGNTRIKEAVIPDGVVSIGEQCFESCSYLVSITLPASVTEIAKEAFSYCKKLSEVHFGGIASDIAAIQISTGNTALTSASWHCVDGNKGTIGAQEGECGSDTTWSFSDGILTVTGIGEIVNCSEDSSPWYDIRDNIVSIVIEEGVTTIGDYAFYRLDNLTSVTFPSTLVSIGTEAFRSAKMESITLPNGLTQIGPSAFGWCTKLKSVDIPDSVVTIGASAFYCCTHLEKARISPSISVLNKAVFGNTRVKEIIVPAGVTSIGERCFESCGDLVSIKIPVTVTSVEKGAFSGCKKLKEVHYEGTIDDARLIDFSTDNSEITSAKWFCGELYDEVTTAVSFMRVKVNNGSNVRSGPSSDYDKIAYADAGEIYDCLGEENGWYKIKLKDGNFGYIATSRCSVVD